jgi:hypothetical protein
MAKQTTESDGVRWASHRWFLGLDWAKDHHDIVVLDSKGAIVLDIRIEHTSEGWHRLRESLGKWAGTNLSAVAATIETNCGPAVERLLDMGCTVYPLNPKAAQRYRDRKAPSGGKTDHLDALSFADALRTDGHGWRQLEPEDPNIVELRLLCRDEMGLIGQRTGMINQLQQAHHDYYPAVLEAFDDWTMPAAWAFVEQFPTS